VMTVQSRAGKNTRRQAVRMKTGEGPLPRGAAPAGGRYPRGAATRGGPLPAGGRYPRGAATPQFLLRGTLLLPN
jgi:hypothetical protein